MDRRFSLLLVFSLLVATTLAAVAGDSDGSEEDVIQQVVDGDHLLSADHHFRLFKCRFGKSYATKEEHDYRFSVFKKNLRRARLHQRLDPSVLRSYSGRVPPETPRHEEAMFSADSNKAPILPTEDLPADFDWRDHKAVTSVKNQGF